ncbi:MAG: right-handed parallel beta-helix repeat-containing protein [Anaerolineae bacterium]|nr:right-handed parallel beta-helix repeat-containing protein [Anaerolineae bacterium]
MKHKNLLKLLLIWVIALAATMALLFLLRGPTPAIADPIIRCVAPSGSCGLSTCQISAFRCLTTIQAAVDAANDGDEIWVEQGTYHLQGKARQVVYISKTVTIRGGYDNGFQQSFPLTQPTVVDAQGNGRGLYIDGSSGNISPTVEGLWITGGNASNALINNGLGGGIYSDDATPIIAGNIISNNIAYTSTSSFGAGGGIYVHDSPGSAVISANQVISNVANTSSGGEGGGIYVNGSPGVQVVNNVVLSNTGVITNSYWAWGGGIFLGGCDGAMVDGNRVEYNVALAGLGFNPGVGAGIHVEFSDGAVLNNNVVRHNIADLLGSVTGFGGGISTEGVNRLRVEGNTIEDNSAGASGRGGGLWVYDSHDLLLSGNRVLFNSAVRGGGFYIIGDTSFTMTNNIVAGNVASSRGGGLAFDTGASQPVTGTLLHNTFAANNQGSGDGRSAIHVNESYVSLVLTNNLIYSHTYGIIVAPTSTVRLFNTLFYANGSDTSGAGTITNTNPITGQAPLLDGTYHLQTDSPAIDAGVDAGVTADIDGEARDSSPDIGADEFVLPAAPGGDVYLPIVLKNH